MERKFRRRRDRGRGIRHPSILSSSKEENNRAGPGHIHRGHLPDNSSSDKRNSDPPKTPTYASLAWLSSTPENKGDRYDVEPSKGDELIRADVPKYDPIEFAFRKRLSRCHAKVHEQSREFQGNKLRFKAWSRCFNPYLQDIFESISGIISEGRIPLKRELDFDDFVRFAFSQSSGLGTNIF